MSRLKAILDWLAACGFSAVAVGVVVATTERVAVWFTGDGPSAIGWRAWLTFLAFNAFAAALVGLWAGVAHAVSRFLPRLELTIGALLFGVGLSALSLGLGEDLASGGWISQQSWAWLVELAPAAAAFAGGALAWRLTVGTIDGPWFFVELVGLALLVGGPGLIVADHMILLGTYPGIHLFLWGAAVVILALAGVRFLAFEHPRWSRIQGTVFMLAALGASAAWFAAPMAVRGALMMGSPMANNLVRETLPPVEFAFAERDLATIDPDEPPLSNDRQTAKLDRKDWNVLWITVDTLRADALYPVRKKDTAFARSTDTPFLNSWLRSATAFRRAYSQSSATHRSMPPMFRSLEAHEDVLEIGEPLGAAMSESGRTSAAVVNNFFLEPRFETSQSLLWGFDIVSVHEKADQHLAVGQLQEVVSRTRDDGFFVWLHFYCMHAPGYDGKMLSGKVNAKTAYRKSLKWLDEQMKGVIEVLEKEGVADDTIVIFSADHGEGLGDNRIKRHGPTVYDEETRVPLAIYVPGAKPRLVEETVGNVDIVPTVWDALGLEPSSVHKGRSLVPAILGKALPERPYYVENWNGTKKAVVVDEQKLVFDDKADTFLRFDLEKDPKEDTNLFADDEADQKLLAALYRKNPELVAATPIVANLVADKLGGVDPEAPGAELPYLVALAGRAPSATATKELERLFERAPDPRVKLIVLRGLMKADAKRARAAVEKYLPGLSGADEIRVIRGLTDEGLRDLDAGVVNAKLTGKEPDQTLHAWFRWLSTWKSPVVGAVLAQATSRTGELSPTTVVAMTTLARHAKLDGAQAQQLREWNRGLLDHEVPRIRLEAIRTAAALEDRAAVPRMYELLKSETARGRQAAIHALAEIEGEKAVAAISEAGKDQLLVLDAIKALERIGSDAGLPYLQDVAKNHYNGIIRNNAKSAIKRIK